MTPLTTILFLAFLILVHGQKLLIDPSTPNILLLSFGSAEVTISALYHQPHANATFSTSQRLPKFTLGQTVSSPSTNGLTNYSFPITFSSVGVLNYTMTIGNQSVSSNLTVAGFDIFDGDDILSGNNGKGVVVGLYGWSKYDVRTAGLDEFEENPLSDTTISFVRASGAPTNMRELDLVNTRINSTRFLLALNDFRIGDGNFVINFQANGIRYNGDIFKTTLKVRQESEISPPCVAITSKYSLDRGFLSVPMYNVLSPPRKTPATALVKDSNGRSATLDTDKSSLVLPDQIAVFDVSDLRGSLNITCDGSEVLMRGPAIALPDTALATDLIRSIQRPSEFGKLDSVSATFDVLNSSPERLTAKDGSAMLNKFCEIIRGYSCVIQSVKAGSANVDVDAWAIRKTCDDYNELITNMFRSCEFQTAVGYECNELTWDMAFSSILETEDDVCEPLLSPPPTPTPSPSASPSPGPCIGATHLSHLPQESLVYPRHLMARVLCDLHNSCATSGHMVVFQGEAMMMKTYCDMVECSEKVMLVNSLRSGHVESETDGLVFTKFAARYSTRIEELVMKGVIRLRV